MSGTAIGATDVPVRQLRFLCRTWCGSNRTRRLSRLSCAASMVAFAELERAARPAELAAWAGEYRRLADALRASRPDVADAIVAALTPFCTPRRALALAELYATDAGGRARANAVVEAFGAALAPGVHRVARRSGDAHERARARPADVRARRLLAPALVAAARPGAAAAPARAIVKVLGFAGAGYESVLADQLEHGDEQTGREALRALAHIGSSRGGRDRRACTCARGTAAVRAAAEEALRHFPPAAARRAMRELLGNREFVLQHPQIAVRLIDRAEQAGTTDLEPALRALMPLRFRFWNPALVRVALKARHARRTAMTASTATPPTARPRRPIRCTS